MKKLLTIIIGFLIYTTTIGQTVDELDKKGGFKDFKIGEDIETYKNFGKFTKTLDNADTKMFLIKDLVSVKTYTGEVEMKVYKDKVQEIIVTFKNSSKAAYEDILKSLETLYGSSTPLKKKTPDLERFERIMTWTGKKISLRLSFDEKRNVTEMAFIEHTDTVDKLKNEF
ncbi:hypothetical protein BH09BAC3_BH09BAC3_08150 [soil metagenome]